MTDSLIFSYHPQGCTILISKGNQFHVLAELSAYDCLRQLRIEPAMLFAFMAHGTESYFPLVSEATEVPQVFYDAFKEKGDKA